MRAAFCAIVTTVWMSLVLLGPSMASAQPSVGPARSGSLLQKAVPSLPPGFRAEAHDPWGHREGEQDAQQFVADYNPDLMTATQLQKVGFLDAYSEFASGDRHKKSDYLTISLVRVATPAEAAVLISKFQQDLTTGLGPPPPGGTSRKVTIAGIPGSEGYLTWFEGSAALDVAFAQGDVVADIERTSPSKAVANQFQSFARQLSARLRLGSTSVT